MAELEKGMMYSQSYGDLASTVPMFDDYINRLDLDAEQTRSKERIPITLKNCSKSFFYLLKYSLPKNILQSSYNVRGTGVE